MPLSVHINHWERKEDSTVLIKEGLCEKKKKRIIKRLQDYFPQEYFGIKHFPHLMHHA